MENNDADIGQMIFKYEGDNNVEVSLLIDTLEGLTKSYKDVVYSEHPDANVQLRIEALNKGSFEIVLSAMFCAIPPMLQHAQMVQQSIKLFLDIIKLKNDLKGATPKRIVSEGEKTKIVNQNGEVHYYNCNVVNNYINNPIIDKGLSELFSPLNNDGTRRSIKISGSTGDEIEIPQSHYVDMSKNIIDFDVSATKHLQETIIETELLLKKPDLLGESRWQFQYNKKTISATIEDSEFLDKVRSSELKALYAGVKIPVEMKITIVLDENLEVINRLYTILKITDNIIEPENFIQTKFLE